MYTISLDESGNFEKKDISPNDGLVFIAGVIYDGDDVDKERMRIQNFFNEAIHRAGCGGHQYPYGLHANSAHGFVVAKIKQEYKHHLAEFIKDGTYNGSVITADNESREGKYYVYELLKSKDGVYSLNNNGVSDFLRDSSMSNLYVHMAEDILFRTVFSNPLISNIDEVGIDLATRVTNDMNREEIAEYENAYDSVEAHSNDELRYVEVTNRDVYRTAFAREMVRTGKTDLTVDYFQARSMKYNFSAHDQKMEFLHLSDAICTYLGNNLEADASNQNKFMISYGDSDDYIAVQQQKIRKLAGNNAMLFLYDGADVSYQRAWDAIENGHMYDACGYISEIERSDTAGAVFYNENWVPRLKEKIKLVTSNTELTAAVRRLYEATRNNNVNLAKLKDTFDILVDVALDRKYTNPEDEAVIYDIYDAGTTLFNHMSRYEESQQCQQKSRAYEGYVDIFRQIRMRNAKAVSCNDAGDFTGAEKICRANVEFYEGLLDIGKDVINTASIRMELGKCLSQWGQTYAYLGKEDTEEIFLRALKQIVHGTPDYYITESYLLHYYIDNGMKKEFEEWFDDYINVSGQKIGLSEKLDRLIKIGSEPHDALISLDFGLFVYVKAFDEFYADDNNEEDIDGVLCIEDYFRKGISNRYPWVLIFRHLASIAWKSHHDTDEQKKYEDDVVCLTGINKEKIDRPAVKDEDILTKISRNVVLELENRISEKEYTYPEELTYMYR